MRRWALKKVGNYSDTQKARLLCKLLANCIGKEVKKIPKCKLPEKKKPTFQNSEQPTFYTDKPFLYFFFLLILFFTCSDIASRTLL